jgi:hypothetical protein
MANAAKAQKDAFVAHSFLKEPRPDARLNQEIDRALFENSRADALDDVLAAAVFDDDGIDAFEVQQVGQQQSGRTRADDSDLRAELFHRAFSIPYILSAWYVAGSTNARHNR